MANFKIVKDGNVTYWINPDRVSYVMTMGAQTMAIVFDDSQKPLIVGDAAAVMVALEIKA